MVGGCPNSSLWNVEYEELVFKEVIGKGNFGCVYRGTYLGVEVAIKQIPTFDDPDYCKYTEREVRALRYIRHPFVVHFFGVCKHSSGFYLVTEFIEGLDLRRFVKISSLPSATPPTWESRVMIALDIAKTLLFLHSKGILHRDLKSKNVLLDIPRNVTKICDFGFARMGSQYSNGDDSSSSEDEDESDHHASAGGADQVYKRNGNGKPASYRLRRMSICGTPSFMAPEILLQQKYDWSVDVFSFGVVLAELLTLKRPGKDFWIRNQNNGFDISLDELKANITGGTSHPCPQPFLELCIRCCAYLGINRPKFSDIIQSLEDLKLSMNPNPMNQRPHFLNTLSRTNSLLLLSPPAKYQQSPRQLDDKNNQPTNNNNNNANNNNQHQKNNIQTPINSSINSTSKNLRFLDPYLEPICIFKEKKRQSVKHSPANLSIPLGSPTSLDSYAIDGVLKLLNPNQFPNGWKDFGINSHTTNIWLLFETKDSLNKKSTPSIEMTCVKLIKIKKQCLYIYSTDPNLYDGIGIVNIKPYQIEYPHLPSISISSGGRGLDPIQDYDVKDITKIQSVVRGWLVRRRFKVFQNNWSLSSTSTLMSNKRTWMLMFNQLIDNEVVYKNQLDNVIRSYLLPVQSKFRINKPLINYKEIASIFSNIEAIFEISNEFLKLITLVSNSPYFILNVGTNLNLDSPLNNNNNNSNANDDDHNPSSPSDNMPTEIQSIAQFIIKNINQIKNQYGIYAYNFKYAMNILNWCRLNPEFGKFLETVRMSLNHNTSRLDEENDLQSLLSLPINKVQKYLLVFEKLVQITPITHTEYSDIKNAYTLIKDTSNAIQTQLEMSFEHSHLMSVDIMLLRKDNVPIAQNGRWFVRQSAFEDIPSSRQYYLFLLSDVCLVTKPVKSKSKDSTNNKKFYYQLRRVVNLKDDNVSMRPNNDQPNSVIFTTPSKVYKLAATSEEEAMDWINDFERTTLLVYRNNVLDGSNDEGNGVGKINNNNEEINPNIPQPTLSSSLEHKGFIKRFRQSITSGSTPDRKSTSLNILTSNQSAINPSTGNSSISLSHSGSQLKSVLSSPTINYSPTSTTTTTTTASSSTGNVGSSLNQSSTENFVIPTTPSEKKKVKTSFTDKLKRLSHTFTSSPVGESKKSKEISKE
ncbi:hypothetical protein CYY_007354 [Polysphondylium violaceum]|uniref:non-specific serine/threonine protein kinase n=1 Tax=Polysphondylium violaceum TaxID=133409 RepID=A0A8J4UY25_9MYCE|nr:hypothetical protein CYY_007354 [Polysphondylium violaceum]